MTHMASWTEVIDTTTGRIYASCDEVERRTGMPAMLVDACIQTGKSINGHHFERATRMARAGIPLWAHQSETGGATRKREERKRAKTRSDGRASPGTITTPEDRARAVEMYKQGALLSDISAALGRSVQTRDITRWNGGVTPERPGSFWNHGQGRGITINNNRPSWENDA